MKDLLLGLLIGGMMGLWLGVNLGKQQTLFSNPFELTHGNIAVSPIEPLPPKTYEIDEKMTQ